MDYYRFVNLRAPIIITTRNQWNGSGSFFIYSIRAPHIINDPIICAPRYSAFEVTGSTGANSHSTHQNVRAYIMRVEKPHNIVHDYRKHTKHKKNNICKEAPLMQ